MLLPILGTLSLLGAVYFLMPLAIGVCHIGMFWPAALLLLAAAWCFFPGFFRRFPKWLKAVLLSGVGLVLAVALAVLAVVKRQELLTVFQVMPALKQALAPILLLAGMLVSGMVFFTASSVSLEGKSYWIVRSMPVPTKKVLRAKLNLSNSLSAGPALLMMLVCALVLGLPAVEVILLLACQLLFVLLTANVGLVEDLRHCNLDWINETQAAKQGAGVLLSMLLAFGFVVAVGALYFFLLAVLMPATAALGLILALMAILYALTARWLMTRGVKRFETLR